MVKNLPKKTLHIHLVALHAQFPQWTLNCFTWEGKGLEKCGRETQAANGITTPACQDKKKNKTKKTTSLCLMTALNSVPISVVSFSALLSHHL